MTAHQGPVNIDPELIRKLSSCNRRRRWEAEDVVAQMGPAGLDVLLAVIAREEQLRKRKRLVGGTALAGAVLVSMFGSRIFPHADLTIFHQVANWWYFALGAFSISTAQTSATVALSRYNDVRSIGAFAHGLEIKDDKLRGAVEDGLIKLLPRMRASDAALLNSEQRALLNHVLKKKKTRTDLVIAILAAWNQVGDMDALPAVEELANRPGVSYTVIGAAKQCAEYIKTNAENVNSTRTLLRASSSIATAPEILLRAAGPDNGTNSAELLRAGTTDDELSVSAHMYVQQDEHQAVNPAGLQS